MATTSTSIVYAQVIEHVISKMREEFIKNGGPGQGVLNELQRLWELKMIEVGAIPDPIDTSFINPTAPGPPTNPIHDLNVPYEESEEYKPPADLFFPPPPMQTPLPVQIPLPGTVDSSYNIPIGSTSITPNDYPPVNNNGASESRGSGPYMHQRPPFDVNAAYVDVPEEIEIKAASQVTMQDFFHLFSGKRKRDDFPSQHSPGGSIPQQDGAGDLFTDKSEIDNYQEVVNEDYNVANTTHPPEVQTPTPAENDVLDDEEEDEPLNENDDLDEEDDVDHGDEFETYYIILSLFDKVTRTKSKWKCSLTNGAILHRNTKDILFNKATGEFDF